MAVPTFAESLNDPLRKWCEGVSSWNEGSADGVLLCLAAGTWSDCPITIKKYTQFTKSCLNTLNYTSCHYRKPWFITSDCNFSSIRVQWTVWNYEYDITRYCWVWVSSGGKEKYLPSCNKDTNLKIKFWETWSENATNNSLGFIETH